MGSAYQTVPRNAVRASRAFARGAVACNGDYDNPKGREAGRRFDTSSAGYPSRRRRGRGNPVLGAGRYGGVTVPALPVRFVAGSAVGFPDVSIGRRIAVIAEAGGRTGNRFRLRGRPGVPWGAVRGPGGPGRVRPVGRRAGGFAVAGARASGPTG